MSKSKAKVTTVTQSPSQDVGTASDVANRTEDMTIVFDAKTTKKLYKLHKKTQKKFVNLYKKASKKAEALGKKSKLFDNKNYRLEYTGFSDLVSNDFMLTRSITVGRGETTSIPNLIVDYWTNLPSSIKKKEMKNFAKKNKNKDNKKNKGE